MTSGQKIAFSTLLSMLIFAGFVIAANIRLFPELETRFYAQAKVTEKVRHLDDVEKSFDSYITTVLKTAEDFAKDSSVSSYMEHNPSEKSVTDRRNLTEQIFKSIPPLTGIRIIDKNGRNVHYSSFDKTDVLKQTGITKVYKNYTDIQRDFDELDYSLLKADTKQKILVDSKRNRLILSQPFFLYDNIQSGSIIFYLNLYDVREQFVSKNVFSYGEGFSVYSDDKFSGGIVLGVPLNAQSDFKAPVLDVWNSKHNDGIQYQQKKIVSSSDGEYWTILSASDAKFLKISGIYRSSVFELSTDLVCLIYICVFITVFLIIYLLFSFSQDSLTVIRKKIKQLQAGIIQEYLENKQDVDWAKIAESLRLRKSEFVEELKAELVKKSKRNQKVFDELLEKAWNDVIAVFESQQAGQSTQIVYVEKPVVPVSAPSPVKTETVLQEPEVVEKEPAFTGEPIFKTDEVPEDAVEDIEEVEDVDEVEVVENLDEVSDVEDLDEVDDVDEIEEVDDVDEVGDVDNLDEVEEVDEVEDLDDSDELEELDDVEQVEDVEELENLDEVEPATDVEDVAELEDADEVEDVESLEEIEDVPDLEEVSEVEDLEEVPEVENLEEVEDIEDLDAEDDVEVLEEIPDLSDTIDPVNDEEVEELDEVDDAEPVTLAPIEDLQEYDEFITEKDVPYEDEKTTFYNVENLFPGREEYFEDKDAFIRSERFATVNNLFAEEISLGDEYDAFKKKHPSGILNFKVHKIADMYKETQEIQPEDDGVLAGSQELLEDIADVHGVQKIAEDIADLTEELPPAEGKVYFSMTAFASDDDIKDLEEVSDSDQVIYETDGVFHIATNLDYSGAVYNPDFKALVDSVLHN